MKRITNHTIYEIWNEYTAESVYVDHKPTNKEVMEIRTTVWGDVQNFPYHRIIIEKLKPMYGTSFPKSKPPESSEVVWFEDEELWDADPKCKHDVISTNGGGVKCTKCRGWFCL